tara:strand:+ start:178 stop:522 length:345 start_codon:yes stop_codon:yes gene_type:complete
MLEQLEENLTKEVKNWKQKKEGHNEPSLGNLFTGHITDTDNPQSYWVHGRFAFMNSFKLLLCCILGMIHAVFPWWFKFTTSTAVIKAFKIIVDSKRHRRELQDIIPDYLNKDRF